MDYKTCTTCLRNLPREHFSRDRSKVDGRRSLCKSCGEARRKAKQAGLRPEEYALKLTAEKEIADPDTAVYRKKMATNILEKIEKVTREREAAKETVVQPEQEPAEELINPVLEELFRKHNAKTDYLLYALSTVDPSPEKTLLDFTENDVINFFNDHLESCTVIWSLGNNFVTNWGKGPTHPYFRQYNTLLGEVSQEIVEQVRTGRAPSIISLFTKAQLVELLNRVRL